MNKFKEISLGLIGIGAFLVLLIIANTDSDNYFISSISTLLNFSGSLVMWAVLIFLIICFCIWMLAGFMIPLSKKLRTRSKITGEDIIESLPVGIFWLIAMLQIIFTFITILVGSITIFEKFMGIYLFDSYLGGLLVLLIFILSGMASFGVGALWFKSDYSPLSKFMKDL